MGGMVSRYVFMVPSVSYDASLDHLVYVDCRIPAIVLTQPVGRDDAFTILFSHGNAEDLGCVLPLVDVLFEQCKFNVCAWDYQGYGLHKDRDGPTQLPTEDDINEDLFRVYKYLINIKRLPAHKIILYGRSLGTGPTCALAAKLCELQSVRSSPQLGGIVLQSGFLSCLKVAGSMYTAFLPDMFDNESRLPTIDCPALVIHGTEDSIIPLSHGDVLAAGLVNLFAFLRIEGGDHNNLDSLYQEEIIHALLNFASHIQKKYRRRKELKYAQCLTDGVPLL